MDAQESFFVFRQSFHSAVRPVFCVPRRGIDSACAAALDSFRKKHSGSNAQGIARPHLCQCCVGPAHRRYPGGSGWLGLCPHAPSRARFHGRPDCFLFHCARCRLGIDLGPGGALAGPQWQLGKSAFGGDYLRGGGGAGGQSGAPAAASQPHASERFAPFHQHSGRAAGVRLARFGRRPDHCRGRSWCFPRLYGTPGRTGWSRRVTSCHRPGLNSALPASLYARVRARMAKTTEMNMSKPKELGLEKLRWRCELSRIPFETTAQAQKREGFIGQERALRALKMGVELSAPGYNVFVCGLAGTSRGGTIAQMIEELHPATKPSMDRCYVNNFKIPDRPRLLVLPRGSANAFKKDVQAGIDFLRRRIPQMYEGATFQRKKGVIVERFSVRKKELMDDFTRRIARDQFALGHMQVGAVALPEIFPVLEGQMVPIEDISKMVHEGKLETGVAEEIERKYEQFRQEFTVVYRKTLTLSRELASELSYLEQEAASVLVDGVIGELKEKHPGSGMPEYLET